MTAKTDGTHARTPEEVISDTIPGSVPVRDEDGKTIGFSVPLDSLMKDAKRTQPANHVELLYMVYKAFNDQFDGIEVECKYNGETVLTIPLANGHTGTVSIESKSPERVAEVKARGY
jgi:hypothetical protein